MPLYRKSSAGGGIGAVTLQRPSGETEIFNPDADTVLSRGVALKTAIAASVAGDSLLLGPGIFSDPASFPFKDNVAVRGVGKFVSVLTCTTPDTPAVSFASEGGGTVSLSDLFILGMTATGGGIQASGVRFSTLGSAIPAVDLDAMNGFKAATCDFLADATPIVASAPGTVCNFASCIANGDLDANILPTPPAGITIDPAFT